MSKRLQVLMSDDEYRAVARLARRRGQAVAHIVRESLRRAIVEQAEPEPEQRIARVLAFASCEGPTGDIAQLLSEIERGQLG